LAYLAAASGVHGPNSPFAPLPERRPYGLYYRITEAVGAK
jgi:hypothetical protein